MIKISLLTIATLFCCRSIVFSQAKSSIHNLGPKINSKDSDFGAYLLSDGLTLYFVSKRNSSNDQFWFSKRASLDSSWENPEPLKSLNIGNSVGGITFDEEGNIYFASNNGESGPNNVDIWEGTMKGNTLNVSILPRPVNSEKWESQPSISSNGRDLYYAVLKPGYLHKVGIVVSHKLSEDKWSEPIDIGPNINIGDYSATPAISPDGKFLFFTSSGKSNDHRKIYFSSKIGPKDTDWSEATLLPGEINSYGDNIFPMIAFNGKIIYFSSNRDGGFGGYDIYQAELPPDIQAKIAGSYQKK